MFAEEIKGDAEIEVEIGHTFTEAAALERSTPKFPARDLRREQEGWVVVNYMVDPQGKPYDLVVSSSSGEPRFEKEALQALSKSTYTPATLNGQPIDSGLRSVVTFELSGGTGARRQFQSRFRSVLKAIKNGQRDRADEIFQKMWSGKRNLYESAYYHLAKYQYELTWGTPATQYRELNLATFNNRTQEFLPDQVLVSILREKMKLQLARNKLAAARDSGQRLLRLLEEGDAAHGVRSLIEAIDDSIASDQQIVVPIDFQDDTRFIHTLVRPSFTLSAIQGEIAELRVHCKKGLLVFKPEIDMRYRVREGWNDCTLIMIGNPETTASVIEDHI